MSARRVPSGTLHLAGELALEPVECSRQARLHRATGEPEDAGGFVLAEIEEVAARHDVAVVVGKRVERRPYGVVAVPGDRLVLRRRRRTGGSPALARFMECTCPAV